MAYDKDDIVLFPLRKPCEPYKLYHIGSDNNPVLKEPDPYKGILHLDNWIQKCFADNTVPLPTESIHKFEKLLRMRVWPCSPAEATGVSETLKKLQDLETKKGNPILPEASYLEYFFETKAGLNAFMEPLSNLRRKCHENERVIKGILGKFSLSAKGSLFETGIHDMEKQNDLIVASLLSRYSAQVARRRMERRRLTDEVLAYDNDAIMRTTDPALPHSDSSGSPLPGNLPHPDVYDQPTKADLIRKMIHRTFMGLSAPAFTGSDFKLPYNISEKAILRKVTSLQLSQGGLFSGFSWQAAFHSRLPREILACAWWWMFLCYFRTEDEDKRDSKLCLLLRRLGKAYRRLYRTITANFRDRILEVFPDCIAQAVYMVFNEAFPFQREQFIQPRFLVTLESQLHRWFMGGIGAASEHYRFKWQKWRFEYMDLNKIHDPDCYPPFFDLKLKSDPIPQACDVLGTEKVILDVPQFRTDLTNIIRNDNKQRKPTVRLELPDPAEQNIQKSSLTASGEYEQNQILVSSTLESDSMPGFHLEFETTSMEINAEITPLLSAEISQKRTVIPTSITRIKRKVFYPYSFADVVRDVQMRIRQRHYRMRNDAKKYRLRNRKAKKALWIIDRECTILKEDIAFHKLRRNNVGELRLEIMAAQDTERHLPGAMRRKLRKGDLPALLDFKNTKEILTTRDHSHIKLETFLGSFFDWERKAKLTEWDKMGV